MVGCSSSKKRAQTEMFCVVLVVMVAVVVTLLVFVFVLAIEVFADRY